MYIILAVITLFIIVSFYFPLTFMECLKEEDKRKMCIIAG